MEDRPRLSGPLVAGLTGALTAALMGARLTWIEKASPEIAPKAWAALPFATLLGLGMAVVIGLVLANRQRWRAVLRPSRGRVIGALVLTFVTPVVVINWGPWTLGPLALFTLTGIAGSGLAQGFEAFGLFAAGAILWYPVASLVISGIRSRPMRLAIFALMFWASYSGILIFSGTRGL